MESIWILLGLTEWDQDEMKFMFRKENKNV